MSLKNPLILALLGGVILAAIVIAFAVGGSRGNSTSSPTNLEVRAATLTAPAPTRTRATPTPEAIDPRAVFESIRERYGGPAESLNFGAWEYVELTGDGRAEVLVRWNEGGNCGYFAEVWGYYRGQLTNLTPHASGQVPNDFGCGSIEATDVLGVGRPQVVTKARTYARPGVLSDDYSKDIYCWNGAVFLNVATDYEDYQGNPVRPRLAILDPSECR